MERRAWILFWGTAVAALSCGPLSGGVGDPQVKTDHPWYPGELACSSFERLFATQAEMFHRAVGRRPESDQDRALAAWMWRNLHYAHGEEGKENLWGNGFEAGDSTTREYWTGLFAHGFGLCGTTHAQWTAELNALLGHGRSRTVGVVGHNACEVFLQGGAYGPGRWALLDHDVSTVVFDPSGTRMLSIDEIRLDLKRLTDPTFAPDRQQGWPLGGLHRDDPAAYAQFNVVEHLPGYAGPPPMGHLRRGETLRRYFQPGLEDGRTFVYWGRNYRADGIPGPERSRTWVNQPERFRNSPDGSGYHPGRFRFGNAVYTYVPDFANGDYREGLISENDQEVVLEFQTPYIIAATPATDDDWGIYQPGCRNGLVIEGRANVPISISVDRGKTWSPPRTLEKSLDLTDLAKGHRQYRLKLGRPAAGLADSGLKIVTVCQANPAIFPRLKDQGAVVSFAASRQAIVSAGPNLAQAAAHVVEGAFDTPRVTLELEPPRSGATARIHAAGHVASSNPPDPEIRYQIEYSTDGGRRWDPIVRDWKIIRQGNEPPDFWSQSFCYGDISLPTPATGPVRVRFRNDGGKRWLRTETHLVYEVPSRDKCRVTFSWSDDREARQTATHEFAGNEEQGWRIPTANRVVMHWVEFGVVP